MSKLYSLDEIAKSFNIPKSTLRYWESEGLISSKRNKDNDYREYTYEDIVIICDILFYRSLHVPIKKLKNLYSISLHDNISYLRNLHTHLTQEIDTLHQTQKNIEKRIHSYDLFVDALNGSFHNIEPPFDYIFHIHPTKGKNLTSYLNDQSVLALTLQPFENPLAIFGTTDTKDKTANKQDILWKKDSQQLYKPCLVQVQNECVDWNSLTPLIQELEVHHTIHHIILSYLVTDQATDYYLAWIEYSQTSKKRGCNE